MKNNRGSTLAVVSVIIALVLILGVGSISYVQMQAKRSQSNKTNAKTYQENNEESQLAAFEMKKAVSYTIEGNERDSYYKFYPILLTSSHEYFDSSLGTTISKMTDYFPGAGWESTNGVPKHSEIQNLATFSTQTNISSIGGYVLTKVNGVVISNGSLITGVITTKTTSTSEMLDANGTVTEDPSKAIPQSVPSQFTNFVVWNKTKTYKQNDIIYYYDNNPNTTYYNNYRSGQSTSNSALPNPPKKASFWKALQPTFTYYEDNGWLPGGPAYSLYRWEGDATPYLTKTTITNTTGMNDVKLEFTKYVKISGSEIFGVTFGDKYYKYTYTETLDGPLSSLTVTNANLIVQRVTKGEVPNISLKLQTPTTLEETAPITTAYNNLFQIWALLQATDKTLVSSYDNVDVMSHQNLSQEVNVASTQVNQAQQEASKIPKSIAELHGDLVDLKNASDYSINKINVNSDTAQTQKAMMLLNSIRTLGEEYKVQLLILGQLSQTPGISSSTKASLNIISVRVNRVLDIVSDPADTNSMESVSKAYLLSTTNANLSSNKSKLIDSIAQVKLINNAINSELSKISSATIKETSDKYILFFNSGTIINSITTLGTIPVVSSIDRQIGLLSETTSSSTGTAPTTVETAAASPISIGQNGKISILSSANMMGGNFTSTLKFNETSILPSVTATGNSALFSIQPGESKSASVSTGETITITCTAGQITPILQITQLDRNTIRVTITSNNPSVTGSASLDMMFNQ
ncbi:MAG: hypothetical protein NTX05_06440 [Fusobacteria bacterium]|nr:hypothetical protein [Fusobacteriota bacterium]